MPSASPHTTRHGRTRVPVHHARDSRIARLRIALLGFWLGAMLAFGGLFVPAAFANLPTPLAASVLGAGFAALDRGGARSGVTCVALGLSDRRARAAARAAPARRCRSLHLISAFVVTPKIHALRMAAGGAIGQADGPELAAFAQLHAASRGLFGLAAASALRPASGTCFRCAKAALRGLLPTEKAAFSEMIFPKNP